MTETLNRPDRPLPRPPRRTVVEEPAPPVVLGASAALWAAILGLLCVVLPVLLVWATDGRSGTGWVEAARAAGRFWLVAHGASLDVPGGRYALTPLGLLLLPLWLVARFAAAAARDVTAGPARLAGTIAGTYGVLAMLVAVSCSGPDVHVSPLQSLAGGLVVGGTGAAYGVLRPGRALWPDVPRRVRRLATAGGAAVALLLGAGALLVGGSLAVHGSAALDLARSSDPGALGGLALLLAGLALVPNALVWGVAWLTGPGFAVGVGTAVGPFGHELGPVPALPLLAALPGAGVPEWVAVLVLAVPLLAGAVGGRLVAGELGAETASWTRTCAEAAAVGPVCGAVIGVLAWLSGGAVGGERLVELGPAPLAVAAATTVTVGVGALAGALVRRARILS